MKQLLSTLVLFLSLSTIAFAQPNSELKVIKLTNGAEYIGTIISDDGREMLFESTTVGKIYIKKTDVKSITNYQADDFVILDNEKVKPNPFGTRYAFTTNALPIKKKENYYMINLWGPECHFAVADNFNLGVMTTWIGSPFALAAKYSFQTKNPKLNFSIGEIAGNGGYIDPASLISLSFGNVTFGDCDRNITLGLGYGYFDFNQMESVPGTYYNSSFAPLRNKPATTGVLGSVAANFRINDRVSFIFDSMFGNISTGGTTEFYTYNSLLNTYSTIVTPLEAKTPLVVIMPAFRVSQGPGRAVQLCLAGISSKSQTIPIPFVTWYRTL